MTESGQGNEPQFPAVPPAHEGVVLPAQGDPWVPEQRAVPAAGQPWGQPWGPESEQALPQPPQPSSQPSPPQRAVPGAQPPLPQPTVDAPPQAHPLPQPAASSQAQHLTRPAGPPQAQTLPSASEETQLLPPQQARQGNQPLPPQAPPYAAADSEATQLIPPTPAAGPMPGAPLPPEAPSETTTFLGRRPLPDQQPAEGRSHGAPLPPQSGSDAEATQLIGPPISPAPPPGAPFGVRPGMPGDRQPPAEFDGLFRSEHGGRPADATQQFAPYQPPQGRAAARNGGRRRGLSPAALIAIVVAGCAVAGLAAGAALSSGGEEKAALKDSKSTASAAGDDSTPSQKADPAEAQAKQLDALLNDSNNSRASVIRAVQNVRTCSNLGQAAADLRSAANQRNDLVTRLGKISVDKLPNHAALTSSLVSAWKASASADSHYAAWAGQVAGKKGCPHGHARRTPQTAAGDRASGVATKAKRQAAQLWNEIASRYGLTRRDPAQL